MRKKEIILFILVSLVSFNLYSQIDSLSERLLYNWTIDPFDLNPKYSDIDTTLNEFQHFNPLLRNTITSNYLGNLGTAAQSNIYYDRRKKQSGFLFSEPYAVYFHNLYEQTYYNTKRQFTLLNYGSGGPREESEQTIGVLHTQNVTKDFNVGIDYDLISSAGRYQNQKAQVQSATLFSSYKWKGYRVHANYTLNKVTGEENGGLDSIQYLGSKEYKRERTIPVKLSDAGFTIRSSNIYLAQEYRFGKFVEKEPETKQSLSGKTEEQTKSDLKPKKQPDIKKSQIKGNILSDTTNKEIQGKKDIDKTEDISKDSLHITNDTIGIKSGSRDYMEKLNGFSISHELFYTRDYRKFTDENISESFYNNLDSLISNKKTNDAVFQNRFGNKLSAHYRYKDLFSIRLSYFNEHMEYEYNIVPDTTFILTDDNQPKDTSVKKYLLNEYSNNSISFYLHSFLFKRILFEGYGEYFINGYKNENSIINTILAYRFFKDTWVRLEGEYKNQRPNYFYEQFESNHFKWDNKNLIRKEEWDGNIIIRNEEYRFDVSAGYGQITGHIFLDTSAKLQQYGSQINIFTARASKKITLGPFHSTTRFVYQTSSNDSILSLPKFNFYQSLYYEKLFHFSSTGGELRMQAGIDYRYSSSFMADGYMPVTGLFYRQYDQKIADYHCLDIFINFSIKRARLYLIYNYLNTALSDTYYFTAPSYPAPPALFKFGISWAFYD